MQQRLPMRLFLPQWWQGGVGSVSGSAHLAQYGSRTLFVVLALRTGDLARHLPLVQVGLDLAGREVAVVDVLGQVDLDQLVEPAVLGRAAAAAGRPAASPAPWRCRSPPAPCRSPGDTACRPGRTGRCAAPACRRSAPAGRSLRCRRASWPAMRSLAVRPRSRAVPKSIILIVLLILQQHDVVGLQVAVDQRRRLRVHVRAARRRCSCPTR